MARGGSEASAQGVGVGGQCILVGVVHGGLALMRREGLGGGGGGRRRY